MIALFVAPLHSRDSAVMCSAMALIRLNQMTWKGVQLVSRFALSPVSIVSCTFVSVVKTALMAPQSPSNFPINTVLGYTPLTSHSGEHTGVYLRDTFNKSSASSSFFVTTSHCHSSPFKYYQALDNATNGYQWYQLDSHTLYVHDSQSHSGVLEPIPRPHDGLVALSFGLPRVLYTNLGTFQTFYSSSIEPMFHQAPKWKVSRTHQSLSGLRHLASLF